jgi:RHS repeat-associated protein
MRIHYRMNDTPPNNGVVGFDSQHFACRIAGLRTCRRVRNLCHSRFHSHPLQSQSLSGTARTCLEGPFGELLRATGPMAKANPFRFSTKYQDDETDLLYYGFRYERDGRWLSRDPLSDHGQKCLYTYANNDPVDSIDLKGLRTWVPYPSPGHYVDDPPHFRPVPSYPPPSPIDPKRIERYDCSCCGTEEVSDGLRELTRRFLLSAQWLENHNVVRDPNGKLYSGGASCYNGNAAILQTMNPTPRCWVCFMDRRRNGGFLFGGDENFIHCFSMGKIHREVVFDWFEGGPDDNQIFRGGVYQGGALDDYFKEHPYQAPFPTEIAGLSTWVDCWQQDRPWTFDVSTLKLWVQNPPALR